jgi:hypothetical protein
VKVQLLHFEKEPSVRMMMTVMTAVAMTMTTGVRRWMWPRMVSVPVSHHDANKSPLFAFMAGQGCGDEHSGKDCYPVHFQKVLSEE